MLLASLLLPHGSEHYLFRAAVLSIVLTLAIGPNAELLCKAWCHPQANAANECRHEEPANSASVAGDNGCDHVGLNVGAFLREEIPPGGHSSGVAHAVVVPRYQLARLTTDARPAHEPGREWSLEKRPLSTALRI